MKSTMHVCIVGPDGAGKTTTTNLVAEKLAEDGFPVERLTPRPSWFHTVSPSTFDYHNPHAQKPRTPAKSRVQVLKKLAFYALRRASSRTSGTIYLEERGWLDQAVDHLRYRVHSDAIDLVERTERIVGRPDLTVVLGGDAETIANRKHELDPEEVGRQLRRWDALLTASPKQTITLETTALSVDETVARIYQLVRALPDIENSVEGSSR